MAGRARTFTAALLLVLPVSVGVGSAPAHAAPVELVNPGGGCWSYEPDRSATDVLTSPGGDDLSSSLEAWGDGAAPTTLTLEARGASLSAHPTVKLTVENGPVIDPTVAATGSATAVLAVQPASGLAEGQLPTLHRLATDFSAEPGASVDPLVFEGPLEGAFDADTHVVELQSLYFDRPALPSPSGSLLVCNLQEKGEASVGDGVTPGVNPRTAPVAIGLKDTFVGVNVRTLSIQDVKGQSVTSAFRAGDQVDLRGAGIDAGDSFTAEICDASGTCSAATAPLVADTTDGVAATVTIGDDLKAGPATVVVQSAGVRLPDQLGAVILGAPSVSATETEGKARLRIDLAGAGWDPGALVTVQGRTPDASSADAPVEVTVGADGTFKARFVATDVDTTSLTLEQQREGGLAALSQTYTLDYLVPLPDDGTAPDEGNGGSGSGSGTSSPGTTTSVPPTTTTAAPPVEIPLPAERPVDVVDAPVDGGPADEGKPTLKISEEYLAGEATLGEMFGGSSPREVRFLAENVGTSVLENPLVRLGVGRDTTVVPGIVAAEVGDLQPGARVAVAVDVALPMASFGVYQVVGQVGDSEETRFSLEWQTYPWGLIALNLMGVALLAWGLWRRQQRRLNPSPLVAGAEDDEAGASVIDLTALDNWWGNGKIGRPVDDNDSVVDMDAANKWWAKRDSKVS